MSADTAVVAFFFQATLALDYAVTTEFRLTVAATAVTVEAIAVVTRFWFVDFTIATGWHNWHERTVRKASPLGWI